MRHDRRGARAISWLSITTSKARAIAGIPSKDGVHQERSGQSSRSWLNGRDRLAVATDVHGLMVGRTEPRHSDAELFTATGERRQIYARDTRLDELAPLVRMELGQAEARRAEARATGVSSVSVGTTGGASSSERSRTGFPLQGSDCRVGLLSCRHSGEGAYWRLDRWVAGAAGRSRSAGRWPSGCLRS